MKKKFLTPLVVALLALGACERLVPISPDIDLSLNVDLDATTMSLAVGENKTISAVSSDGSKVTWVNSDSSIISMETMGNTASLTGIRSGVAYVTAILGASSQYCIVTVGGGSTDVTVTSVTLSESSATLDISQQLELNATVISNVGTPTLTWTSSNTAVATVVKTGTYSAKVTPVGAGTTNISVLAGNKTATCMVTVSDYSGSTLAIKLDQTVLSLEAGKTAQLNAEVKPAGSHILWQSNNEAVATVSESGVVSALTVGTAVISATVSDSTGSKTATCNVSVKGSQDASEYEKQIAAWSKPGHLYMHYLRNSDQDYNKWALWIWQNYPNDSEGSLWGANTDYSLAVSYQTQGFMSNADVGLTGTGAYIDDYGVIIDVDLTAQNVPGGKTGANSPLIYEDQWTDTKVFNKLTLGFLIVDQSKMTGEDMWTSDGGAETYIKKLGKLMPEGRDGYIHVYCVEGNVTNYQTSSGKQEVNNPTLDDTTGQYRSHNDIQNLKYDAFTSGVSTSTSFLDDEPGVGYQIFVPSFCDSDGDGYGDLQGIISKLGYLDSLGVKVLWLTPIQESNSYHGYDVTDYYKIDQRYGTLQDYQELIYKAHDLGMKVLMDMVINHTSKSNVLFQKSQRAAEDEINGKKIKYRDMYLWKYAGDPILEWDGVVGKYDRDNPANYVTKTVESSSDWYKDGTSNYYYFGKFGSGMAELNYSSQSTRDYMTDMCKYWLSFGLDGFRLDAIKHIYLLSELDPTDYANNYSKNDYISYDVSYRTYYNEETFSEVTAQNDYSYDRDLNVKFWKQFAGTIKSAYPNCFLVGENFDGWNERMAPFYESMDSQFDFSTYYHLNEKPFAGMGYDMQNSLKIYKSYRSNAINGAYTSNHDIPRLLNHAAGHVEDYTASGNHHVEVNNSNASTARNNARVYAAMTLLTPGVSWVYYGDELGMSGNTKDRVADSTGSIVNDHGNNVDRWYRQPMRWGTTYGQDGVVDYKFSGLEVLWDNYNATLPTAYEQMDDQSSMFNLFAKAAQAKNDSRYPTYGNIVNYWDEVSGKMVCIQISDGSRTVNVFINFSPATQTISELNRGQLISCSYGGSEKTVGAYGFTVVKK